MDSTSLLMLTFCLPAVGLQNTEALLSLSGENPNNSIIFITVRAFVYFLVPLTFTLSTLLMPFHITKFSFQHIPVFAPFFKNLIMGNQICAFVTLMLGMPLMVISSIPLNQDMEQAIWAGSVCIMAGLILNSLQKHFQLGVAHHESPIFVLGISAGALLLSEQLTLHTVNFQYNPLIHVPIQLLAYLPIPTFFLGTTLLLLRLAMPHLSVGRLDKTLQAMIFTTILTVLYSVVYLGFAELAGIDGGGVGMEIGMS